MPARANNPRAADQLRREFGVLGERLHLQVDDVVVPVAIVSDLTAGSSGVPIVRRCYADFYQADVLGEYGTWRLEIPSGYFAIVNRIWCKITSAYPIRAHWGSTITAPANIAPAQLMDGRLRSQGLGPVATLAYGTQVAVLANPVRHIPAGPEEGIETAVEWPFGREDGYVDFLEMQAGLANEAVFVTVEWDEVALYL